MYVCRAFLNACFGRFKVGLKDLSLVLSWMLSITLPFLSVSPSFKSPNMVKNINFAFVSGGSFPVLDGNGSVGDSGLVDCDDIGEEIDVEKIGGLDVRFTIFDPFFSDFEPSTSERNEKHTVLPRLERPLRLVRHID